MSTYYAAMISDDGWADIAPRRPFPSYSAAIDEHARYLSRISPGRTPKYQPRVLLDLGSVCDAANGDEPALNHILADDPILRTMFELGRAHGRTEA